MNHPCVKEHKVQYNSAIFRACEQLLSHLMGLIQKSIGDPKCKDDKGKSRIQIKCELNIYHQL